MKLLDVLKDYDYELLQGSLDTWIEEVDNDTRKVKEGYLFIAEKGFTVDGHDFIEEAVKNGAIAVVVEELNIKLDPSISVIKIKDTLDGLARLSSNFYGRPSDKIELIGITGTNGKTSTTYFLESIYKEYGRQIGVIGTVGTVVGDCVYENTNTTPNALELNRYFKKMVDQGIKTCIIEVSSHALALKRVNYMDFEVGVFINLAKDHLDYHETIENYFESKALLFPKSKKIVVNNDDSYGCEIIRRSQEKNVLTYGIGQGDLIASNIKYSLGFVDFQMTYRDQCESVRLNIPGEFSVYNGLSAAAIGLQMGIDLETIKKGLENLSGVVGRFQVLDTNTNYKVIIDFAHTADGLEKVLKTIGDFATGRVIVVFGAGGNRDKTKRPEMGAVVGNNCDIAVVTSDNPRHEDPDLIIEDVVAGMENIRGQYVKITDREEAIKYALQIAEENDIILLAGKGHENYTIIGDKKIDFNESEIVFEYLNK